MLSVCDTPRGWPGHEAGSALFFVMNLRFPTPSLSEIKTSCLHAVMLASLHVSMAEEPKPFRWAACCDRHVAAILWRRKMGTHTHFFGLR